ncbi:hypothetical protein M8756_01380 [Lutimaribacter sp. EGI FJ00015]|uniref:Uncharacterized protein n=1 Tax=Lutimaribacter degradans TaxID=2945989 RepID=A0ACC5ZT39_9RHOB|nr:hypothetical protein [Lutimaribacter sp. EGI FJ00013]MCM2561108.1 hypothetical protein [Lutimaribacter sp. EGI FJ00013]MCO0611943.1 hypothetical protein [Lutimaribacter sp. EGI FJ00015]MCO0634936.1 hypothetical protein [Lutimaribacter sp. EGI FJ00014]
MRIKLALILSLLPLSAPAQEAPLSAIDWLSTPTALPLTRVVPAPRTVPLNESPVAETATIPTVNVTALDEVKRDAVGLLPASVTGLPRTLWQASDAAELAKLMRARKVERLPAMQSLLFTLLLAEAEAPEDSGTEAPLLQARVDALMELGAVEPAQALLERAGAETPALFPRWFDATLLTGDEDRACQALRRRPDLHPDYGARIFCTARGGDWPAAALTLDTARALGFVSERQDAMLARFLDPEMFESAPLPMPPVRPDPLLFRIYEAVGEPLPTATLPLAFAMADLRTTAGWKAQLTAAERLARSGALSVNRLLGIYSERLPAASGGIWDRVAALQRFDTARRSGEPGAVAQALPSAWRAMRAARLEIPFAELYGADLMRLPLTGDAGALAYDVALLSPAYEQAARTRGDDHPERAFETALAQGDVTDPGQDDLAQSVARGMAATAPPEDIAPLLEQGKLGEAILQAIALYERGHRADTRALEKALATFRAVGLEDTARRAALQTLLLGTRG